ncbi:unnamed protein product [Lampetra planeri]
MPDHIPILKQALLEEGQKRGAERASEQKERAGAARQPRNATRHTVGIPAVDRSGESERWIGAVDWSGGSERWIGAVDQSGGSERWI